MLHGDKPAASREIAEVEVESVAYIVCDVLGLDTGDYSFPYVARWASGDVEKVKERGKHAVECARRILQQQELSRSN